MAKLMVYAVWDNAVGSFSQPHCSVSRGAALREFMDVASSDGSPISKHRSDFSLFELGEYDQETGQFVNHKSAQNLGSADMLLSKPVSLNN